MIFLLKAEKSIYPHSSEVSIPQNDCYMFNQLCFSPRKEYGPIAVVTVHQPGAPVPKPEVKKSKVVKRLL